METATTVIEGRQSQQKRKKKEAKTEVADTKAKLGKLRYNQPNCYNLRAHRISVTLCCGICKCHRRLQFVRTEFVLLA